jgi:DNA-binding beta-propeller fold protein YncE
MMRTLVALCLLIGAIAAAQEAPIPAVDEIGGHPFSIRDKWVIGGTGNWDYLALDPVARQLFITHQTTVQVVDIETGQKVGEIGGFTEARSVLLDPDGQSGYVTDGRGNKVMVFDRRALRVEYAIPLTCAPRSMTLIPQQQILVAICGSATPPQAEPRERARRHGTTSSRAEMKPPAALPVTNTSKIAIIDTAKRKVLTYVVAPGDFRMAQANSQGQVFVTVGPVTGWGSQPPFVSLNTSSPHVARVDVQGIAADARQRDSASVGRSVTKIGDGEAELDQYLTYFQLDRACENPQGLAIDNHNERLFVACGNQIMLVLDAINGRGLTKLTVGPGSDAIAFDEGRGLIFTANGEGYGSLSIVREHETDSYALIQNLPTMERARTLALDPSTGQVYLVTDLHGAKLDHPPANGIGTLKLDPVDGSFQVLVVGN